MDARVVKMKVERTRPRRRGDTRPDEVVQGVDMMDDRGCRCSALAGADIDSKAANGSRWHLFRTNSLPEAGWTIDDATAAIVASSRYLEACWSVFSTEGIHGLCQHPSRESLVCCLTRRRCSVQTV